MYDSPEEGLKIFNQPKDFFAYLSYLYISSVVIRGGVKDSAVMSGGDSGNG